MGEVFPGKNMYSCENLAKQNQEIQPILTGSEHAISRDRIAKNGKSFAELVEKYRPQTAGSFK